MDAPSLRSLSGKTLDVLGRKTVQLDCGNGHSLSVRFYERTALELCGVSDMHNNSIDHLFQIGIAAAQGRKESDGSRWDTWAVNEPVLKLIRHVKVYWREMLDPRINLANKSPVPMSRLTGERVTFEKYKDGSTLTVKDKNFLDTGDHKAE